MTGGLAGQRAVVTGAAGGVGGAVVHQLQEAGVAVVGLDRSPVADVSLDIAEADEVSEALQRIIADGSVEIVVHCAAITLMNDFESTSVRDFDRVMAVNARGTFNVLSATLPHLRERGYGRVVVVASIAASFGYRFPAYSASKAAVIALAKSAAVEYAEYNVTVNSVSPGRIATPMAPVTDPAELRRRVPVGRAAEPDDVAAVIVSLVRPEMGYVTGTDVVCDGGMSAVFALHGLGPYSSRAR